MSEKTKEVKTFQDTMYIQSLHGHKHQLAGENIMSTFENPSMNIGCTGKLGHLFGFLRHYLLNIEPVLTQG